MCDSSCGTGSNRFTITRGVANTFVFTIKADGSTLPIIIQPSDTFVAKLMLQTDTTPQVVNSTALSILDANSGKVQLTYSGATSATFTSAKGGPEDRYYIKPLHYLLLECSTQQNGYFIAKVDKVYVD